MLITKDVIGPGTVWYNDLKTGEPRKSVVTAEHVKYWHDSGNEMLAAGLAVPVPCEHDFDAHPMTPADKLKSNAGWVKEYKLCDGRLLSVIDVPDEALAKKLPTTVKWTSPWFSSFTDGAGKEWKNVIAHLALTTRPRVTNQAPFPSIAAAMDHALSSPEAAIEGIEGGIALSLAGLLKLDGDKLVPEYKKAFSHLSGVALSEDDIEEEEPKGKKNQLSDSPDDMKMDKLLCDLLCILGVPMPEDVSGSQFKKALYMAAMAKIKELSAAKPPVAPPAPAPGKKSQVVQEQHPMYMTLEDINKITDETTRNIALSMYNENVKMQASLDANNKLTASLRDGKLAEENAKRKTRVDWLGRVSPKVKVDLEAMLALPAMALSMGDGGAVTDPMAQTLSVLEKGLSDVPRLLVSEVTAQPHPSDAALALTEEEEDKLADSQARMMGCPPEKKAV